MEFVIKVGLTDGKLAVMFIEQRDGSSRVVHRKLFKLSPSGYDSMNNAMLDWLTDGRIDPVPYNGEVS